MKYWGYAAQTIRNKLGNLKLCVEHLSEFSEHQNTKYYPLIDRCNSYLEKQRSNLDHQHQIELSRHETENQQVERGV